MLARLLERHRFAVTLALLFALQIMVVGAFLMLGSMVHDSGQRAALLMALALLLLLGLGLGLHVLFRTFIYPLARLGEDVVLMKSNSVHRVMPQGATEVRALAAGLNDIAMAYQALQEEGQARIADAGRELAQEKTRLAALMTELSVGVLVCNIEGRILLYNRRARQLLARGEERPGGTPDAAPLRLGLGRSLFGLVERGLVVHALEQIQHRLRQQHDAGRDEARGSVQVEAASRFVATLGSGLLVRARMAPVLDEMAEMSGFVLVLEDITREVEVDSRRDALLLAFTRNARAALANLRAAVETLQAYPGMEEARRERIIRVIEEESQRLAQGIERALNEYGSEVESRREFEEMRASDLLALLWRRLDSSALRVSPDTAAATDYDGKPAATGDEGLWLAVDSYALSQGLAYWCRRMADETDVREIHLGVRRDGGLARIEFSWQGTAPGAEVLRVWELAPPGGSVGGGAASLDTVLERHAGESVYRYDAGSARSRYSLLLPASAAPAPLEIASRGEGRPVFYDFDLFRQGAQDDALDNMPLAQISFTVFDTETTGLHPAAGDEIISIGAVRIVNGRLLQQENFDRLIRPRCPLSADSVAIHGITEAMLEGQPRAEQVLPQFQRFVEDTVLVAHNAAFDLRFLQMQEEQTGVRLDRQVLDTLLLSQVIHPHQAEHTLEAIAARLGVAVVGRHTALGDAIVTAEVFLRMLPLLAGKGILTYGQARDAEQQTRYARLRY